MARSWPWLRAIAAVGILVTLALRLGTDAFVDGLRAINAWSVLAALGIGLLTTVLSAWRWCVVARGLGLPLALRTAVSDYYRALLLNSVLPAGVLGDVHRAVRHGRQTGDIGRGVRAVVFERFAGQAVLITIGVAVLFTQPRLFAALTVDITPSPAAVITVVAVLALAAGAAVVITGRSAALRRGLHATWVDARSGLLSRHALPKVIVSSAATVVGHVAMFVIAARVAGSSASIAQLVPLIVLALLVMALPLNVGGWGPREAFLAVAFGAAGLGAERGLTTAVVYGVLAMIAGLPGILVLFRDRSAVEDREVLPERLDQARQQVPALAG